MHPYYIKTDLNVREEFSVNDVNANGQTKRNLCDRREVNGAVALFYNRNYNIRACGVFANDVRLRIQYLCDIIIFLIMLTFFSCKLSNRCKGLETRKEEPL